MSNQSVTELINILREENKIRERDAERRERNDTLRELRIFLSNATVKPYNGSQNISKIQYFLDEINRISSGFELSDEQKIVVAGRNMSGIAEKWYFAYREEELHIQDSFSAFGERLKDQFGQKVDLQMLQAKLMACVHRNNLENYNHRFLLIIDEFPKDSVTEVIKVATYLSNLKAQLRCEVKIREPTTLGDAMKYARILEDKFTSKTKFENDFTYNRNYFHQNSIRSNPNIYNEGNDDAMKVDNFTISKTRGKRKVCYNCGKEGHFASNCPNKSKN